MCKLRGKYSKSLRKLRKVCYERNNSWMILSGDILPV